MYVDEIEQARVFDELLTEKKFIVHTHVSVGHVPKPAVSQRLTSFSARAISNPIKSFISLIHGDMLKQQVSTVNIFCFIILMQFSCVG